MRQKWNNRSDRSYMMKIYAIYLVLNLSDWHCLRHLLCWWAATWNPVSSFSFLVIDLHVIEESIRHNGFPCWVSSIFFFYPCILYVCVLMGCFFLNGALGSEIQFCFIQSWWRTHISCPCFFWIFLLFTLLTWCIFQSEYTTCILKNCHYIWNITYKVFTKKTLYVTLNTLT